MGNGIPNCELIWVPWGGGAGEGTGNPNGSRLMMQSDSRGGMQGTRCMHACKSMFLSDNDLNPRRLPKDLQGTVDRSTSQQYENLAMDGMDG